MLRTIIQTREEGTGKELAVPGDLREKVERAAEILAAMLGKIGEQFDIEARWWFDSEPGPTPAVMLSLSSSGRAISSEIPTDDLRDDDSISRRLRIPIKHLVPAWSQEVDRQLSRIRRDLEALATVSEE
jgi:hypothetical protein